VKDGKIVKVTAVEDAQPNQGRLCVKGRFAYDFIYSEERLKTPLIREKNGEFREASWDEALDLVATKFKEIIKKTGRMPLPASVAPVVSTKTPIRCRNSSAQFSVPIISITARVPDTLPPSPVWRLLSVRAR